MSHNLQSGFFGRGIPAWHKLGTVVNGTLTSEEAIKTAGLDWEIVKHPIFARIPQGQHPDGTEKGIMKRVDSLYATVRTDNNHPLGVVGPRYTPIQNSEGFAVLDSLAKDGFAKFDTAGSLGQGETVWMLMLAEELKMTIAGDSIQPYFLATMKHDGTGCVHFKNCGTRVVCANTLAVAMSEKVSHELSIRHTVGGRDRMKDAARLMGLMKDTQMAFVSTADQLLAQPYSRAQYMQLIQQIMPAPDPSAPDFTDRRAKSWEERFRALMNAYAADDLNNVRNTAWGAFNAVADWEQHAQRVKGDEQKRLETLFTRSFLSPDLTAKAFAALTA